MWREVRGGGGEGGSWKLKVGGGCTDVCDGQKMPPHKMVLFRGGHV